MARRHRTKEREISIAPRSAAPTAIQKPAQPTDHFRHALLGGVAALLVARPLVPSDGGAWVGDGQIAVALWIALAALWLVQSLGRPQLRVRFGWIDGAMIAWIGWWSASALLGSVHAAPRPSINMLWEGVAILLTFLLLRQLVEPEGARPNDCGREARALVAVMIAVGVTLAITAIYQFFVTMPEYRQRFIEHPPAMFREAEIEMPAPNSSEFRRFADRLNSPEPIATFNLTNSLAAYLAPWLVISLGIALVGRRSSQSGPLGVRSWLAAAACALPIAVALALTRSRSAWIGTGVGFACLAIWRLSTNRRAGVDVTKLDGQVSTLPLPLGEGRGEGDRPPVPPSPHPNPLPKGEGIDPSGLPLGRRSRLVAIVALIVVILGGGAIAVRPQLFDPAIRSFRVRLDYWQATCAMIADHPWFGCGPGNFDDYYTQYKLPAGTEEIKDPHNFALEVAACAGLPALLLLLTVLAGFALRLRRRMAPLAAAADASQSSDGTRWIFGGTLIGFWLALGWNFIVGFPAHEEQAMAGIFAAGITAWLLWPWICGGTLPPRLCGLGVLVLLVALLAVGGITFGGVNETLWLLLALGLNATESRPTALPTDANEQQSDRKKSFPWIAKALLLAAVVFLWFAQHQTAYEPMLGCQMALNAARDYGAKGDLINEEHQLLVAAEADPYAVEPRRLLASFWLGQWLHGDKQGRRSTEFTSQMLGDFENSMNQALALQPRSAPLFLEAGTGWRLVLGETKLPADGRKAVEFCRRAAELYPTGVVVQFELAQTLSATGDSAAAKDAAREALRLDDLRPEAERALGDEQCKLAERIILGNNQPATQPSAVPLGPPLPPPTIPSRNLR